MRAIYCINCGSRMKKLSAEHEDPYRAVEGKLIKNCVCDGCNARLASDNRVVAFSCHPRGPEAIGPWEHEYIKLD